MRHSHIPINIEKAVSEAESLLGDGASPADVQREAEKLLVRAYRSRTGPGTAPKPCRITLDLPLADCASRLEPTVRALVYDKVRRWGTALVSVARNAEQVWGGGNPRLFLRLPDSGLLMAGHDPSFLSVLVGTLQRAAVDSKLDRVCGPAVEFSSPAGFALIERLPDVLENAPSVCPVIHITGAEEPDRLDEIYAVMLAVIAASQDGVSGEVILTTRFNGQRTLLHSAVLNITVTANAGTDLAYAGHQAYQRGLDAMNRLLQQQDPYPGQVAAGMAAVALSEWHVADMSPRSGESTGGRVSPGTEMMRHSISGTHLDISSVRSRMLEDVPRSAKTDVLVDGLPLSRHPRNRIVITPDLEPRQAANVGLERLSVSDPGTAVLLTLSGTGK